MYCNRLEFVIKCRNLKLGQPLRVREESCGNREEEIKGMISAYTYLMEMIASRKSYTDLNPRLEGWKRLRFFL